MQKEKTRRIIRTKSSTPFLSRCERWRTDPPQSPREEQGQRKEDMKGRHEGRQQSNDTGRKTWREDMEGRQYLTRRYPAKAGSADLSMFCFVLDSSQRGQQYLITGWGAALCGNPCEAQVVKTVASGTSQLKENGLKRTTSPRIKHDGESPFKATPTLVGGVCYLRTIFS